MVRRTPIRLTALVLIASCAAANAQLSPTSRLSELTWNAAGLDSPPGPTVVFTTSDPWESVDEIDAGTITAVEPGGFTNTADWHLAQVSAVEDWRISASLSQWAVLGTNGGSPGIFMTNDFELAFTVAADVDAELTGAVVGSSSPSSDDFARVRLVRDGATLFNTGFGHTFPFAVTLEAGRSYELIVEARGEQNFAGVTESSADAVLTLDGYADSDGDGVVDDADNCLLQPNPLQRDSDGDGFGNRCDADFDDNCVVNAIDLGILKVNFFGSDPQVDMNGDGQVNAIDLGMLRARFFEAPGPSGTTPVCLPD